MRRGIVALALATVAAMLWPAESRAAQAPTGIATDPILQPPPYNGQPLDVDIGLHVVNLASINEVSEQFELDAYMFERWIDKRLTNTPKVPQSNCRNYAFRIHSTLNLLTTPTPPTTS